MKPTTLLLASILAAGAFVQVEAQRATASKVPDITGSWERYRPAPVPAGATRKTDPNLPPPAAPPALKSGYVDDWRGRVQAARDADAKGQPLATGYTDCLPDGMPSMMGAMFPMEILQSRGQVTVIEEAFTQVRRILLDRPQKPIDDVEPSFYGYSVGRWEGDTLVVDTIGIKENVRFQNAPHSKEMRIRERIHLVAQNVLWDEITIEDPVTLEKPWTVTYAYRKMPDYTLLEYVCEDNREYADAQGRQKIRVEQK
jgi:hypothetical protein